MFVCSLEASNPSVPLPWQLSLYPPQPQCTYPGLLVTNTSSRHSNYAIFLKIVQLRFFFFNVMFNAITALSFALSVNVPAKFLLTFSCTHVVKRQQHAGWKLGHIQHMLRSACLCQSSPDEHPPAPSVGNLGADKSPHRHRVGKW